MAEPEQLLINQARTDPAAFHELYQQYFPRVYGYVAYRVGRREDTEDIVSETFMKVVEGLAHFEYRGEGSFAAWLFRIAHNMVNSFYRRRPNRQEALPLDELPDVQSMGLPPDQALLQKEKFARLQYLISTLAPRRQEVITLKFYGGLKNNEIATILELDERTVASHLCRAIEDLQHKFSGEYFYE